MSDTRNWLHDTYLFKDLSYRAEGHRAFKAGWPLEQNPYTEEYARRMRCNPVGVAQHAELWEQGWRSAQKAKKEAEACQLSKA